MTDIPWLNEEAYARLEGLTRLKLTGVLGVFGMYGQEVFIPPAIEAIMEIVVWYGLQVRGKDKMLIVEPMVNPERERR